MKPLRTLLLSLLLAATALAAAAQDHPTSEKEYDESIRRPIRRLHPERERENALKEYQRQQQRQAQAGDPWADDEQAGKKSGSKRRTTGLRAQQQKADSIRPELQELLSKDYSLVQIVPDAPKPYVWVDEPVEATEAQLLERVARGVQGAGVRYMPAGVSTDHTKNAFYLYFDERTEPQPLRLRVQYYADDPLNFSRIDFVIDGFEYSYTPRDKQSGHVHGKMIWETADDAVTPADKDLLYALTHCQWAQMSLVGDQGIDHVKLLSDEQLTALRGVLQLYLLRGGRL